MNKQDKVLLAVDIGNTSTLVGVVQNHDILFQKRIITKEIEDIDILKKFFKNLLDESELNIKQVMDVIISSVVPQKNIFFEMVAKTVFQKNAFILGKNIKPNLVINIDEPNTLGSDRIAGSIGAINLYNSNILIIDFGTAVTFDLINDRGEFEGGAIYPGFKTSVSALTSSASLLPEISVGNNIINHIPKNLVDALDFGLFNGYCGAVENIVAKIKEKYPFKLKIVATGGEGELFAKNIDMIEAYHPNLVIDGLHQIYKKNQ